MDNLTHSLIGLIAGNCAANAISSPPYGAMRPGELRLILLLLFVVGGNLPDVDLLLTLPAFSNDPLRYVLEHRGYTHTVVGCCVLALCLYASVEVWAWWRGRRLALSQRATLLGMALLGTLLHLAMDYLNSYGVHPLWPWSDRWVYGDSIFIVEPLYWMSTVPLICTLHSRLAKFLLTAAVVASLALALYMHPHQPVAAVVLVLLTIILGFTSTLVGPRVSAAMSAACAIGVTAMFVFQGRIAAHTAAVLADANLPGQRLLDHVLTPIPTNPLCWDVLLLSTDMVTYRATHGTLSTVPGSLSAADCPALPGSLSDVKTMQPPPASLRESPEVHWLGQFSLSKRELREAATSNCQTRELMQFVRAPFAVRLGATWLLGDLRFDRGTRLGMAQVSARRGGVEPCTLSTPWLPPRSDLLQ